MKHQELLGQVKKVKVKLRKTLKYGNITMSTINTKNSLTQSHIKQELSFLIQRECNSKIYPTLFSIMSQIDEREHPYIALTYVRLNFILTHQFNPSVYRYSCGFTFYIMPPVFRHI